MHICQDEIAAAAASIPFLGYCLLCGRRFVSRMASMIRRSK